MNKETNTSTENPFSKASYWNSVSGGYANVASLVVKSFSHKAIALASIAPSHTAIDVACGTGTLSVPLAKKIKNVVAADFSTKMISEFNTVIKDNGITNIQTIECDGQHLPFEDNTFDIGFSMFGLMFFLDREKGFKELYRVIKPKRNAIVASWAPIEKSQLMTLLLQAVQAGYPEAPSPRRNFALDDPEIFKEEMEEAGFKQVTVHEVVCPIPPVEPNHFWDIMSTGGPLLSMKKEVGEKKWKTISENAIKYLLDTVGQQGKETFTTAYIGVGEKYDMRNNG